MKKCKTVKGLVRAIKAGVPATLEIWGIMNKPLGEELGN